VKFFLESAGLGRRVVKFRAKETVFAQSEPAKNVIYIQEGGVKLTVKCSGNDVMVGEFKMLFSVDLAGAWRCWQIRCVQGQERRIIRKPEVQSKIRIEGGSYD
jgi:CRP-like cAMP-binding protein